MVSIRDIAKQAGYSISTVSRFLNQSGYVSQEAAEKIATIVKELDYSPNQIARDLSSGHSRKIGVVVPHVRHTYFTELIQGLLDAALESHYQLVFLPSDYSLTSEQAYLKQFRAKAFDALIFTSRAMDIELISSYRKYGTIVCMEETASADLVSISINRRPGYLALFNWIRKKNPQKVALLFSRNSPISPTYRETMAVFEDTFKGVNYTTYGGLMRYEDAESVFEKLRGQTDLDCIVSNSDDLAVGLLECYRKSGSKPPLVVSQSSQLSGQLLNIPSIDNHSYQLGKLAFDAAIATEPKSVRLPSKFLSKRNKKVVFPTTFCISLSS
ncbi:TPA: LacI family DNA-binding transcriptional regulator [Streptococcus suis]